MAKKVHDICALCGKTLDQKVKKRKQGTMVQKGNLFISSVCSDCLDSMKTGG